MSSHELIILVEKVHVHDEVAGKELACRLSLLAALDLLNPLRGNQNLINEVRHLL